MSTIALLTDFGLHDPYVGMMKGVMLGTAPEARLVDLSHAVAPQAVREGAFDLFVSYRFFPVGTVFCCVVDPGVGSERRGVALRVNSEERGPYVFVGPDNGLVTGLLHDGMTVEEAVALENPKYALGEVSSTFHGRDVFAPAAAHLAAGVELKSLGPRVDPGSLQRLVWTEARRRDSGWEADLIHSDRFGNLITNLAVSRLRPDPLGWQVWLGEPHTGTPLGPIRRTFADVRVGQPLAYVGSSGFVELAVRDRSAENLLDVGPGSVVSVVPER